MSLALAAALPSAAAAYAGAPVGRAAANVRMNTIADLEKVAKAANPIIGYYDPLNLANLNFWGTGEQGTVGWLRHAEIKHGRVAMAAFIGYIVHENGIRFPYPLTTSMPDYSAFEGLSAPAVWDACPFYTKLQIIAAVGFLEAWSETSYVLEKDGQKHYMKGGKPGYYPTFDLGTPAPGKKFGWGIAHPVPFNLFDPANQWKNRSEEEKERGLIIELNNGRLAMLGIFGFVSEATVPGSVPALTGLIKSYAGDVMAPFA